MSSIYVLESPTKGKVIINTTYGPIDVELWPKEAPKAVRNFVQLCLEGYYDNTIFHRIIKGFLIQGGDPTATGSGGESIYGAPFADEFHSRLRFNHRGIIACANAGSPHTNGSQFFISLDKCEWLDKKNTIFGKVTGDSVFNLLRIGEVDTDEINDKPFNPAPKVRSVEVLWNPFDDIVPRVTKKSGVELAADSETKDSEKKAVKKLNLLSFGEEAEEEEKELAAIKKRIVSSHDVLDDPRLLKQELADAKATRKVQLSVREAPSSKKDGMQENNKGGSSDASEDNGDNDGASFDAWMRQKMLNRRKDLGDLPQKQKMRNGGSKSKSTDISSTSRAKDLDDDQPKVDKLSLKKKGICSEARAERMARADADLQLYGEAERGRLLQKQKRRRLQGREDDVLKRLTKFKQAFTNSVSSCRKI